MLYLLIILVLEKEKSYCYTSANKKRVFGDKFNWNTSILLSKSITVMYREINNRESYVMFKCPVFMDPSKKHNRVAKYGLLSQSATLKSGTHHPMTLGEII